MKHLNSTASIKFAFGAFKKNIILLAICGLIVALTSSFVGSLLQSSLLLQSGCLSATTLEDLISCVNNYLTTIAGNISLLVYLIIFGLTSLWGSVAILNVCLQIKNRGSASVNDLFTFFPQLPQLVVGYVIAVVAIIVSGMGVFLPVAPIIKLIFILPSIYLAIRLIFVGQIILDRKTSGLAAIKKSYSMTQGHVVDLLILSIKLILLSTSVIVALSISLGLIGGWIQNSGSISNNIIIKFIGLRAIRGIFWAAGIFGSLSVVDAYHQLGSKR